MISVLNMKGGVGKTTVSAHVMRVLYHRFRKNILLVDLDAQFNLTQSVITEDKYTDILDNKKTVLSCFERQPSSEFLKIQETNDPPPEVSDLKIELRKFGNYISRLDIVCGNFDMMKFSMIDDPGQLKFSAKYFKRFISQARKHYDLIVLDCNPSSSFITKCALENSTHVLSPVRPDKFSVLGVGMVDRLFDHLGIQLEHLILVNGVKRNADMLQAEVDLRGHEKFGARTLRNRLAESKHLSADPSYTGFATDRGGPYTNVVRKEITEVAREISSRIGLI